MSISKRLRRAVVGIAAVAVLGTVAATASATVTQDPNWVGANDPNTTNVPYLAWRGEDVRLVECFGASDFTTIRKQEVLGLSSNVAPVTDDQISNIFGSIVETNMSLLDWSGVDTGSNQPHEVINGARTFLWYNFTEHHPVICFQDTWDSLKAGLASFKLTVSVGLTNFDNTGVSLGSQELVLQHQFLAGWMNLNAPLINEVKSINQSGPNQNPEGLGDPLDGNDNFFASNYWYLNSAGVWTYDANRHKHPGEIRAVVTGTLPLGQNFSELTINGAPIQDADGNITLPRDWAKLAQAGAPYSSFATDGNQYNSLAPMRWDIHDEMTDQFGNTQTVPPSSAGGRNGTGTTDNNVANVASDPTTNNPFNNYDGTGWFTRDGVTTSKGVTTLPPSTGPTSGPFDPNYAGETLLPDGQLNSGDAPMPAARIDFSIAANTPGQIDGVGTLDSAWKGTDYSLKYDGSNAHAGNLFAPFSQQYIPATGRDFLGYSSGVDGAYITDNFPGFLNKDPLYRNWTAIPLGWTKGATTSCNRGNFQYRTTPEGVQTVAAYTDEHGEARVSYLPGDDFYFDALNKQPGDTDFGCDLQKVTELGNSVISVVARYPYQKVTDPDKGAKNTLTKHVLNLFDKHLSYYPKNFDYASDNDVLAKIVVAHAQDIDGQPFANENVCFKAQYHPSDAVDDAGMLPQGDPVHHLVTINRPNGTSYTVTANGPSPKDPSLGNGWLCTTTDNNGNAVYEASGSGTSVEDVLAYFTSEGLYRHIDIAHGGGTSEDNPPLTPEMVLNPAGSPTTAPGANGTEAPSIATVKAFGGLLTPVVTPAATVAVTPVTIAKTITSAKITASKTAIKLLSLRLVRPAHGKAYFIVKVQSPNKTVTIRLTFKNQHGKTLSKVTKTIAANKLVKIHSSHIKLAVRKAGIILVK